MAETVVLIPGLMCDARVVQHQVAVLSASRAVMVAAPVVGERIEEMASALMDALPPRAALAGIGLGGIVALEILRRAPERVNRIALIAVDPQADTPDAAGARETMIARVRAGRLADVASEIVPQAHLHAGARRIEVQATLRQMALDLGEACFIRQVRALQRRRDYHSHLTRIRVPAMLLGGADDPVVTLKRRQIMSELIPRAELHTIDAAGCLPTLEAPEETGKALASWLSQPLVLV